MTTEGSTRLMSEHLATREFAGRTKCSMFENERLYLMSFLRISLYVGVLIFNGTSLAQHRPIDLSCNGELHGEVKKMWGNEIKKEIIENQIKRLMLEAGDVYPLYDMEVYLNNLVGLSRRCKDWKTMSEIAQTLLPVFDALSNSPGKQGQRWICKGGPRCNTKNGLLEKEVDLVSLQFLGLATAIAASLSDDDAGPPSVAAQAFIAKSTKTAVEKLGDFSNSSRYRNYLEGNIKASNNGGGLRNPSNFIMRDHEVWMLTILANLAGTRAKGVDVEFLVDADMRQLARQLNTLFKSRTTITEDPKTREKTAEIDRGFWRQRSDARYAGYEGSAPPESQCAEAGLARYTPAGKLANTGGQATAPSTQPDPVDDVGWDISHARRLVPLLDAMKNYGSRFASVYGMPSREVVGDPEAKAYARQLTAKLWNQDRQRPLFRNYWSGANGWYRVGYKDGVKCNTGYPPFGLSIAVLVGGYFSWANTEKELDAVGKSIYALINSSNSEDRKFVEEHYGEISPSATQRTQGLNRFMFYSSLIG